MRRRSACLALLLLMAAACGGSGDESDDGQDGAEDEATRRQSMLELVAGDIDAEDDPNALDFGPAGADCFAARVVDDLGVERLEQLGYDVETGASPSTAIFAAQLGEEEQARLFGALGDCVDLPAVLSQVFQRDIALPAPQADCVATTYLDSGLLERSLFSSEPDPALNQEIDDTLAAATESCADAAP